jgi:hypothetical protein
VEVATDFSTLSMFTMITFRIAVTMRVYAHVIFASSLEAMRSADAGAFQAVRALCVEEKALADGARCGGWGA